MSNASDQMDKSNPTPRWVKVTIALMLLAFVGVILGKDLIWAKYYVWKLRQAAAMKDMAGMKAAEAVLTNYPNLFMAFHLYDDPDPQVRLAFVRMAVQMGKPLTGDLFDLMFIDKDPEVRRAAIRATAVYPNYGDVAYFFGELRKDRYSLADKQLMVEIMGRIPEVGAYEELKQLIRASSWPADTKPVVSTSQPERKTWGTDLSTELLAAMVFALGNAYRETNNPDAVAALMQLKNARGGETFTGWLPAEEEAWAILLAVAPADPQVSPLVPLATQSAPTRTLAVMIDQALERIRTDHPTTLPEATRAATQNAGSGK